MNYLWGFLLLALPTRAIEQKFSIEKETTPGESVFLVGDTQALGRWDVTKSVRLSPKSYPKWELAIELPNDSKAEYRFLVRKDFPDELLNPGNAKFLTEMLSLKSPSGPRPPFFPQPYEPMEYEWEEFKNHTSTDLKNSRTIRILKPKEQKTADLTIVYFHDGQNIFKKDFSNYSWRVDETVIALSRAGKIPPVLIVGIDQTQDRNREYSPDDLGPLYEKYVITEVIPFVEGRLIKQGTKIKRIMAGASLGAVISLFISARQPGTFSGIIAMSGTHRFGDCYPGKTTNAPFVYLDSGTIGSSYDNYFLTADCRDEFLQKGFVLERDLTQIIGFQDAHNEWAWGKRFPEALLKTINGIQNRAKPGPSL